MGEPPNMGGNWWDRRTNRYCACPPSRYSPTTTRPTSPDCPEHGSATND